MNIGKIEVELIVGDIAKQEEFEAVVNAANAQLAPGGGVTGALYKAAGQGLHEEARHLGPIGTGEAVITGGHDLPNAYVIHVLGPVFGVDNPAVEFLITAYVNLLQLAEEKGIASLAIPAISTGTFGFPMPDAADIAFRTISRLEPQLHRIKKIRFVLLDEYSLRIHQKALVRILGNTKEIDLVP